MSIDCVERYKDVFGVEPICTTLTSADVPIAASTFYAARTRPPSARAVRDEDLKPIIARVHEENYGVYGIRKVHAALGREQVLAGSQPVALHHAATDERPRFTGDLACERPAHHGARNRPGPSTRLGRT